MSGEFSSYAISGGCLFLISSGNWRVLNCLLSLKIVHGETPLSRLADSNASGGESKHRCFSAPVIYLKVRKTTADLH